MVSRGDAERELWRQTRKYINGMITAPKSQQLPNSYSADTRCWFTGLPDYEDKAAERQLDLRRERNALESAVKRQKDTQHGEFARLPNRLST